MPNPALSIKEWCIVHMDTALAQFKEEHKNCDVDDVLVGMHWDDTWHVKVMVVPSNQWEVNTYLNGQSERELVATVYPLTEFEKWPLVTVDVYLLSPEHVYVHMRPAPAADAAPIAPTEAHKFTEVRPATCTKIGTAVLSSSLCTQHNSRQLGDYLERMYQVDLTFQEDGKIYATSDRGIDLTFNACKKPPKALTRRSTVGVSGNLESNSQLRLRSLLTELQNLMPPARRYLRPVDTLSHR